MTDDNIIQTYHKMNTGRVYLLSLYDICTDITHKYVGSTTKTLEERLENHRKACSNPNSIYRKVYEYINSFGFENVNIELIENVEFNDIEDLFKREQHYIDLINPEMNSHRAYRGEEYTKEYHEKYNETYQPMYYINNREKRIKDQNEYRKKNPEKVAIRHKTYHDKVKHTDEYKAKYEAYKGRKNELRRTDDCREKKNMLRRHLTLMKRILKELIQNIMN